MMNDKCGLMLTRALLTDFYELTMAAGYFDQGKQRDRSTFELYFRHNPFQGGYAVCAGLEPAVRAVLETQFSDDDLEYLRSLVSHAGRSLFTQDFLDYLSCYRFRGSVRAVQEGTLVFPNEPLVQVTGGLTECQLAESILLCQINFQTLIATKAARMWEASNRGTVLEFGLRRAQGPDGALGACRAAFVGGADATSNVLGAALSNMPAKGTHAHSWVQSFPSEIEAFRAFARSFPDECVLLVDTYDVLESGIPNAIQVAKELENQGHQLLGIRIDSGDLAFLSKRARLLLDQAGLEYVKIVASNEIDEYIIEEILTQGGAIDIWGVGTKLVSGFGEQGCALGGVYKLVEHNGRPKIKLSNNPEKMTNPGLKKIVRFYDSQGFMDADALAHISEPIGRGEVLIVDPTNPLRRKKLEPGNCVELHHQIVEGGELVYQFPTLDEIRTHRSDQLMQLHDSYKRLRRPHEYKVGLTEALWHEKENMISSAFGGQKSARRE